MTARKKAPPRPPAPLFCVHCRKRCGNGIVRTKDGVFCKPQHRDAHAAALRAVAIPTCSFCGKPCKNKTVWRDLGGRTFCCVKHRVSGEFGNTAQGWPDDAPRQVIEPEIVEPELVGVAGVMETALARRGLRAERLQRIADEAGDFEDNHGALTIIGQDPPRISAAGEQILASWLTGKSPDTKRGYTDAARHFANWLVDAGHGKRYEGQHDIAVIVAAMQVPEDEGNLLVTLWIRAQLGQRRKASTIATRCSGLRRLMQTLKSVRAIAYVPTFEGRPRRSKRSIQAARVKYEGVPEAFIAIVAGLEKIASSDDARPIDLRDLALCRMASDMGLRRIELIRIDVEQLNFEVGLATIHGKGRAEEEALEIPPPLRRILKRWIKVRATIVQGGGPLLISLGRGYGGRIRDRSTINKMLFDRAAQFGVVLTPHDLRRIFCTEALRQYGPHKAISITRHADTSTLLVYDLDQGKEIAEMADSVGSAIDRMTKAPRGAKGRT